VADLLQEQLGDGQWKPQLVVSLDNRRIEGIVCLSMEEDRSSLGELAVVVPEAARD
jgi:hypothetical protein